MASIKTSLSDKGWVLIKNKSNIDKDELLKLARAIGVPIASRRHGSLLDKLRLQEVHEANPNSLSAIHGTGTFPLHSDTAHWKTPARFVILFAKEIKSACYPTILMDTTVLDFDETKYEVLKRGIFTVKNGRRSFLTTIISNSEKNSSEFIRYDQGCMKPANKTGETADKYLNKLIDNAEPIIVNWEQGDLLIFDNWRFLHGRGQKGNEALNIDRLLYRVLIMNHGEGNNIGY
ncbi:Fe(II)-2OG oxygenase family protein [Ornithinibacillus contaminans]|uniref:TauD/TfdA family dioxygenase n=1 Tax=Ornithinibacillus contaminans TaxID=694055 RepID=UPI00064DD732|nr:TauD/TfdA family dioxygenase [Ornithinibacillus contaminans]